MGVHLTQLITESVEASIHALKLCHDASKVTPLVEEERVDVDGVEGVRGAVDPNRLNRNCTLLRLKIAAFIAPIIEKWLDKGKRTKKWCKIFVIAKGKTSLSRVVESLYTSMIERMK